MSGFRGSWLVLVPFWLTVTSAQAAVSLAGTRLIFNGDFREVSLPVSNRGKHEVLIQAWLSAPEDDDDTPEERRRRLPFVVMPHLLHLPAEGKQALRVLYQGTGAPDDRESLLHLYVLEVPRRREGPNQLNIAVRQRLNVFYRPPGLNGDPAQTPVLLNWTLAGHSGSVALRVSNPTPYHAALQAVQFNGIPIRDHVLLEPGMSLELPLPLQVSQATPRSISFKALTDYGGQRPYCMRLKGRESFTSDNLPLQEEC
ncbi:molecular chaperone [Pseudomonas sp. NPDC089734]|uniref:fimbrial biogenesis chaperone n=1 Tax=Pseudomonas sp. NPDC089734 TaxID=3364469 RepID=UPI003828FAEB